MHGHCQGIWTTAVLSFQTENLQQIVHCRMMFWFVDVAFDTGLHFERGLPQSLTRNYSEVTYEYRNFP